MYIEKLSWGLVHLQHLLMLENPLSWPWALNFPQLTGSNQTFISSFTLCWLYGLSRCEVKALTETFYLGFTTRLTWKNVNSAESAQI